MRPVVAAVLLWAATLAGALAGERPCVASADLPAAAHRLADDPHAARPGASVLWMVRLPDRALRVWFLPLKQGLPLLPQDAHWRSGLPCGQLTVDFSGGTLGCGASPLAGAALERWRWNLQGEPLDELVPPLIAVPGLERDGRFLVQGSGPGDHCSAPP